MLGWSRGLVMALLMGLIFPAGLRADPVIAAAANLQGALEQIAVAYQRQTGETVRISYGSTGSLQRQIRQGAPFEMLLAADEVSVQALAAEDLARDEGVVFAVGRLALVVPKGGALAADGSLEDVRAALTAGRLGRFAIANPEHAPYGMRAREALVHAGLWEDVQPHLVLGENVAQAAQFATTGNADGGLVALSLALSPAVMALADHAVIDADWHAPLAQRMALMPSATAGAEAFFAFVQGAEAQAIFAASGYGPAPRQ